MDRAARTRTGRGRGGEDVSATASPRGPSQSSRFTESRLDCVEGAPGYRRCVCCEEFKPLREFYRRADGEGERYGQCKACFRAKARDRRRASAEAWRRNGPPQTTIDRFWAKVVWNGDEDECWTWEASKNCGGYGHFTAGGRHFSAHRFAYELLVGPIPEGLDLDHLCRVRNCVNPAHLEPVTRRENLLRGKTIQARNAAKTHCPQGHPYWGDNLYIDARGCRSCWTCKRANKRCYAEAKAKA